MFADSVCDSSWNKNSRRRWSTLLSFGIQAFAVGTLLLIPLLFNQALPRLQFTSTVVLPVTPVSEPVQHSSTAPSGLQSNMRDERLMTPRSIPRIIANVSETTPPPQVDYLPSNRIGSGLAGPNLFRGLASANVILPSVIARPRLVSHIMEANLVYRVQPQYPIAAKQLHIQGPVTLRAIISKDGLIERIQVLSGNPILARAAVEAVRQWRYRPYYLNNEPVEVETQVVVNFVLSGS